MMEPTESESKETIDLFIEACKKIADEAKQKPELLSESPTRPKVGRMDETKAARHPYLAG